MKVRRAAVATLSAVWVIAGLTESVHAVEESSPGTASAPTSAPVRAAFPSFGIELTEPTGARRIPEWTELQTVAYALPPFEANGSSNRLVVVSRLGTVAPGDTIEKVVEAFRPKDSIVVVDRAFEWGGIRAIVVTAPAASRTRMGLSRQAFAIHDGVAYTLDYACTPAHDAALDEFDSLLRSTKWVKRIRLPKAIEPGKSAVDVGEGWALIVPEPFRRSGQATAGSTEFLANDVDAKSNDAARISAVPLAPADDVGSIKALRDVAHELILKPQGVDAPPAWRDLPRDEFLGDASISAPVRTKSGDLICVVVRRIDKSKRSIVLTLTGRVEGTEGAEAFVKMATFASDGLLLQRDR